VSIFRVNIQIAKMLACHLSFLRFLFLTEEEEEEEEEEENFI
jgi:hypothetical protein